MKEDQIKWNYNFNYHYKKKIYLLQVLLKNAYLDYMIQQRKNIEKLLKRKDKLF